MILAQSLFALLERRHQVRRGAVPSKHAPSPLSPLSGLGYVEQNLLDFAVVRLVEHRQLLKLLDWTQPTVRRAADGTLPEPRIEREKTSLPPGSLARAR